VARRRRPGRSRRSVTIGLLVLASITIITLDYRGGGHSAISALKRVAHDTFSPIQRGVDAVTRPIGSFIAGAVHYGSVEHQNAELRHEIGQLERQYLSGQTSREDLATLERLLHLPWVGSVKTVTAEVVAPNPSDFVATVQLDTGTRRGVEVGMPVVGGAGLVGVVTESWSSGSTVRLITDPASVVGVRFADTYADVAGTGYGKALTVNLVPPGTRGLVKNEVLTTSGLQNASFPPDIPVARVKSFSSSLSSTQESIVAQPLADLSGLQYVDVMLWLPGGENASR
jgi:rod shape-determining protein MreC